MKTSGQSESRFDSDCFGGLHSIEVFGLDASWFRDELEPVLVGRIGLEGVGVQGRECEWSEEF